jgi:hypothetical protein
MAESVSDKEVQESRNRVDKLNAQIAEEKAKAAARVTDSENAIRKAQLDTEADRLQGQLDALKESNKVSVVREQEKAVISQVTSPPVNEPEPAPGQDQGE